MNKLVQYITLIQEFEQKLNRKLNDDEQDFIKWITKHQNKSNDTKNYLEQKNNSNN